MTTLHDVAVAYGVSEAGESYIRQLLEGLELAADSAAVVASVDKALAHGGIDAFAPDLRISVWCVRVYFDRAFGAPDVACALEKLHAEFEIDGLEWRAVDLGEPVRVELGFTSPEHWVWPLPQALGRKIQETFIETVRESMGRGTQFCDPR